MILTANPNPVDTHNTAHIQSDQPSDPEDNLSIWFQGVMVVELGPPPVDWIVPEHMRGKLLDVKLETGGDQGSTTLRVNP